MPKRNIIRAWRDPRYRKGLSKDEQTMIPESPVGIVELGDTALGEAVGGFSTASCCSWCGACDSYSTPICTHSSACPTFSC